MDSGLDFVATDFPYANKFTIHVLAAVAEYEYRIRSERMKAILAATKRRGSRSRKNERRFNSSLSSRLSTGKRQSAAGASGSAKIRPCATSLEVDRGGQIVARHREWVQRDRRRPGWTAQVDGKCDLEGSQSDGRRVRVFSPEVVAARRVGVAQIKVRQRVEEIGPLLLTWRSDA